MTQANIVWTKEADIRFGVRRYRNAVDEFRKGIPLRSDGEGIWVSQNFGLQESEVLRFYPRSELLNAFESPNGHGVQIGDRVF